MKINEVLNILKNIKVIVKDTTIAYKFTYCGKQYGYFREKKIDVTEPDLFEVDNKAVANTMTWLMSKLADDILEAIGFSWSENPDEMLSTEDRTVIQMYELIKSILVVIYGRVIGFRFEHCGKPYGIKFDFFDKGEYMKVNGNEFLSNSLSLLFGHLANEIKKGIFPELIKE